jgi:hypothetical protein
MNETLRFAILIASVICSLATASAGDPCHKLFGCPVPDYIGKWCSDDYRAKCEPSVCVPLSFTCNDYCPKNVPCAGVPLRFGCDDYDKKCLPKVCSNPLYEFLRCGPTVSGVAAERIAARVEQVEDAAIKMPVRLPPIFVGQLPFEVIE